MSKPVAPLNAPNVTTNFYPSNDLWRMDFAPIAASTALAEGTLLVTQVVASSPTGNAIAAATTNATGQNIVGILAEPITASDTDFATAGKLKLVWVPLTIEAEATFKVSSGTFSPAQVGRVVQIAGSGTGLAVATNGAGAVITGFISATQGKCKFKVPFATTA
jgi:hypothetical protein